MEKDLNYYQNLDKRTKEYKQWKANFEAKQENESKGLGDTIEKITKATGIKKLVEFVKGEDCGCDERKEYLNKKFRYDTPECLTEKEYFFLQKVFRENRQVLDNRTYTTLLAIHNRIFKEQKRKSNCGSCNAKVLDKLKKVYKGY